MAQSRLSRLFSLNFNFLMTLLGGVFLGILIFSLGWGEVLGQLLKIGPGWVSITGQEILPLLVNAAAWNYAFTPEQRTLKFWDLLKMRLVGDSLNYLIPAEVVGEIWRVNSLRRDMPVTQGAASVTVAKFNNFFAAVLFITLGMLIAVPLAPLLPGLVPWLWGGAVICMILLVLFYLSLRHRWFDTLKVYLEKWLPARIYSHLPTGQIEEIEDIITAYLSVDHRSMFISVALFVAGWALGVFEVFLIFYFLGLPTDLVTLVTVETLSVLMEVGLFFIPIKLGTQEGGRVLIFMALGLPPAAGLSFAIVRRLKEVVWSGIGLGFLQTFTTPMQQENLQNKI
jgi:glycosyltransferase 2 family protein